MNPPVTLPGYTFKSPGILFVDYIHLTNKIQFTIAYQESIRLTVPYLQKYADNGLDIVDVVQSFLLTNKEIIMILDDIKRVKLKQLLMEGV